MNSWNLAKSRRMVGVRSEHTRDILGGAYWKFAKNDVNQAGWIEEDLVAIKHSFYGTLMLRQGSSQVTLPPDHWYYRTPMLRQGSAQVTPI